MASKAQMLLRKHISDMVGGAVIHDDQRPNYLHNKATGKNLEVDLFLPKWGIAFEYQGEVHFSEIKRYKNDSDSSRMNDEIKFDLMLNTNVALVDVFYTDLRGDIPKNVCTRIFNSQEFYLLNSQPQKAKNLEMFYLSYIGTSLGIKTVKRKGRMFVGGAGKGICLRGLHYISAIQNAVEMKLGKKRFLGMVEGVKLCDTPCECNSRPVFGKHFLNQLVSFRHGLLK